MSSSSLRGLQYFQNIKNSFFQVARNRVRVETLVLKTSQWSKYAQYGARFSDLYSAALRDAGMLCLAIYRKIEDLDEDTDDEESEPNKVDTG